MNNNVVVKCSICGVTRIKEQKGTDGSQWHIPTHAWGCPECMKLSNSEQIVKAIDRHLFKANQLLTQNKGENND